MSYVLEQPVKDLKRRPTLPELDELIDHFGGNLHAIARHTGYSVRQVNNWITCACDDIKIPLLEKIATSRATVARARLLRPDLPAFIIPAEIKSLVSLYYRLSWDALMMLDIADILSAMDVDPDAPATLRYKLCWNDLRDVLTALAEDTPVIQGIGYTGWNGYVLMVWVGLGDQSPLWNDHEALPTVTDGHLESVVRLLIKRLEAYL